VGARPEGKPRKPATLGKIEQQLAEHQPKRTKTPHTFTSSGVIGGPKNSCFKAISKLKRRCGDGSNISAKRALPVSERVASCMGVTSVLVRTVPCQSLNKAFSCQRDCDVRFRKNTSQINLNPEKNKAQDSNHGFEFRGS
jgi:hypothetical protein